MQQTLSRVVSFALIGALVTGNANCPIVEVRP